MHVKSLHWCEIRLVLFIATSVQTSPSGLLKHTHGYIASNVHSLGGHDKHHHGVSILTLVDS